ncbi:MAG: RsmE family RNA methyltransferase [Nitrospiraceae bacterium]
MPVFFVTATQIRNGEATITGPLLDHLRSSLRIQVGEQIWIGDEQRRRYLVRVSHLDRRALGGSVLEEQAGPSAKSPPITIGQALLKGERMDWVVQKATELGAAVLIPLIADRSIVRPRSARLRPQQGRWQRIAREAAQQAERWEIPTVSTPCEAVGFFKSQDRADYRVILCERGDGQNLASVALPRQPEQTIVMATGPEGGWRQEEVARALERGFVPVTLGRRILRAETATLAALSILQSRLGELG